MDVSTVGTTVDTQQSGRLLTLQDYLRIIHQDLPRASAVAPAPHAYLLTERSAHEMETEELRKEVLRLQQLMAVPRDKRCVACNVPFAPRAGHHTYCSLCQTTRYQSGQDLSVNVSGLTQIKEELNYPAPRALHCMSKPATPMLSMPFADFYTTVDDRTRLAAMPLAPPLTHDTVIWDPGNTRLIFGPSALQDASWITNIQTVPAESGLLCAGESPASFSHVASVGGMTALLAPHQSFCLFSPQMATLSRCVGTASSPDGLSHYITSGPPGFPTRSLLTFRLLNDGLFHCTEPIGEVMRCLLEQPRRPLPQTSRGLSSARVLTALCPASVEFHSQTTAGLDSNSDLQADSVSTFSAPTKPLPSAHPRPPGRPVLHTKRKPIHARTATACERDRAATARRLHHQCGHRNDTDVGAAIRSGSLGPHIGVTTADLHLANDLFGRCAVCAASHFRRATVNRLSTSLLPPSTYAGQAIYCDWKDMTNNTFQSRYRWFLTCVEGDTGHVQYIPCASKSTAHAATALVTAVLNLNLLTGRKCERAIFDAEKDFKAEDCQSALAALGCSVYFTEPGQHNQHSESYTRTIETMVKSQNIGRPFDLPTHLVYSVYINAVDIHNGLPNTATGHQQSPLSTLGGSSSPALRLDVDRVAHGDLAMVHATTDSQLQQGVKSKGVVGTLAVALHRTEHGLGQWSWWMFTSDAGDGRRIDRRHCDPIPYSSELVPSSWRRPYTMPAQALYAQFHGKMCAPVALDEQVSESSQDEELARTTHPPITAPSSLSKATKRVLRKYTAAQNRRDITAERQTRANQARNSREVVRQQKQQVRDDKTAAAAVLRARKKSTARLTAPKDSSAEVFLKQMQTRAPNLAATRHSTRQRKVNRAVFPASPGSSVNFLVTSPIPRVYALHQCPQSGDSPLPLPGVPGTRSTRPVNMIQGTMSCTRARDPKVNPHPELVTPAIAKEMDNWRRIMDTVEFTDLTQEDLHNLITSHELYCNKYDTATGDITKGKERIVLHGNRQRPGTYGETFAPVLSPLSFKLLIKLALQVGWLVESLDIEEAFANTDLPVDQRIVVQLPKTLFPNPVYGRLLKCIYGLKQAPHQFYKLLRSVLLDIGWVPDVHDPCLYVKRVDGSTDSRSTTPIVAALGTHVDDIFVTASPENVHLLDDLAAHLIKCLHGIKRVRDPTSFVGIAMERNMDTGECSLHQRPYIQACLVKYGLDQPMSSGRLVSRPHTTDLFRPGPESSPSVSIDLFQEMVGCLHWCSATHGELNPTLSLLSSRTQTPTVDDQTKLFRVWGYLRDNISTSVLTLRRCDGFKLVGTADAAFRVHTDYRAQLGATLHFGSASTAAVLCLSKKSQYATHSSCEAECLALGLITKRIASVRHQLGFIGFPQMSPTVVFNDNQPALSAHKRDFVTPGLRHMALGNYWLVRDALSRGDIQLAYCPSESLVSDLLTKPLSLAHFLRLRACLLGLPLRC